MECDEGCVYQYFNACPVQCACVADDTIILNTVATHVLIEHEGVQCWYEYGDVVSGPGNEDIYPILDTADDCPGLKKGACLHCDGELDDCYKVIIDGCQGDFAQFNGEHIVNLSYTSASACQWVTNSGVYPYVRFIITVDGTGSVINCDSGVFASGDPLHSSYCYKLWNVPSLDGCDSMFGTFVESSCEYSNCTDSKSCADSAGATFVVERLL